MYSNQLNASTNRGYLKNTTLGGKVYTRMYIGEKNVNVSIPTSGGEGSAEVIWGNYEKRTERKPKI